MEKHYAVVRCNSVDSFGDLKRLQQHGRGIGHSAESRRHGADPNNPRSRRDTRAHPVARSASPFRASESARNPSAKQTAVGSPTGWIATCVHSKSHPDAGARGWDLLAERRCAAWLAQEADDG